MVIDFKEIPQGNTGVGNQDTFEQFTRDFLSEVMGLTIVDDPARGADGGKDIKVKEIRKMDGGEKEMFWLVSCKHYTHSGKSIAPEIESNIVDRVMSHKCTGFIGFYSTIASSSLLQRLEGLSHLVEYQVFDNEKIEQRLIGFSNYEKIFYRYFPLSYKQWKDLHYYTEPIKLFNFYLDTKYQIEKDLIRDLFGSPEELIKLLRQYTILENILAFRNIRLSVYDKLFDYFGAAFYGRSYNGVEWLPLNQVYKEIVPNDIYEREDIKINLNTLARVL